MKNTPTLNQIFARRWAVPILAQLAGTQGSKLVTLTNALDGSRAAIKASLQLLVALDLVHPNPGHGHPMRPEYLLTAKGKLISKPAAALVRSLDHANLLDSGLKKWSMPTIYAIDTGAHRFAAITAALSTPQTTVTDRAISLTLTDLHTISLIHRTLVPGPPPRNQYTLTRQSKRLTPILADIHSAML